jgi:catechol 2,3-dioxygenase-like lactoylglutathione lyase family enzyme
VARSVEGDRVSFEVGGVQLDRPFRVARLGHVGLNVDDVTSSVAFYRDLLGFFVADTIDFAAALPPQVLPPEVAATLPETVGYFMRYGSDHHSFVLFPSCVMSAVGRGPASVTINQLTWQVGSLRQVVEGRTWLEEQGVRLTRSGRDMPGSNWNVYFLDPDGHTNELYYGMEQVGWDGLSKPAPMHDRIFREAPELPQPSEEEEVASALAAGVDLASGTRAREQRDFAYEVDGVTLARPFKIVRLGPVGLFVDDIEASTAFYEGVLGLRTTEESETGGHRSRFLRANTEHHCLALVPKALRDGLELSPDTTTAWIGLQVATTRWRSSAPRACQCGSFLRGSCPVSTTARGSSIRRDTRSSSTSGWSRSAPTVRCPTPVGAPCVRFRGPPRSRGSRTTTPASRSSARGDERGPRRRGPGCAHGLGHGVRLVHRSRRG